MNGGLETKDFEKYLAIIGEGISGLEAWEKELSKQLNPNVSQLGPHKPLSKPMSCVVLNANPFTEGQHYLVSLAAKRSSYVLVLVIQGKPESGSRGNHENNNIVFSFQDRLDFARTGLSDIPGAIVLPSGPYIISRDDFPSFYLKDKMSNVIAHALLNSMVFCHICNSMGIIQAFAGDEPRDELSEIHLNALREKCRKTGIVLKVAERKQDGERYISSSLAREAISKGRKDELRRFVPESVMQKLEKRL